MVLSKDIKEYRERCATMAFMQWRRPPLSGKVGLKADVYMDLRGDLMNREKILLDALQGVLFVNDSQVVDMRMVRHLDRNDPRVELDIWEAVA